MRTIIVNGTPAPIPHDPRVSLLDLLRENLGLFGPKKGCNQGACGACTVLVDGERIISCLAIALDRDELRERMSGNLCRCGAYNGIVDAILDAFGEDTAETTK